jgi:hypothetical protein
MAESPVTWALLLTELMRSISPTIVGGCAGALATWIVFRSTSGRERRRKTCELLDYYAVNADSRRVWDAVGTLRSGWQDGDDEAKRHLLESLVTHFVKLRRVQRSDENPDHNRLTPHTNLSLVLHFWATVSDQYARRLVDRGLCRTMLAHPFSWNAEFLLAFVVFYQNCGYPKFEQAPPWEAAIPRLFSQLKIPFPQWYAPPRPRLLAGIVSALTPGSIRRVAGQLTGRERKDEPKPSPALK